MSNDPFAQLWREIETASDRDLPRAIRRAAETYDDLVLEPQTIPDEAFEFLIKLLSSQRVLKARGIEHFLLEINVDFCKYTDKQRSQLLDTLIESARHVTDQLGRHSIGDLIARAYSRELAIKSLDVLAGGDSAEKQVAFAGFDVLVVKEPKESSLYRKIEERWLALQGSTGEGR